LSSDSARDPNDILTGTTLRVYKFLVVQDKAMGPREVQRTLKLSSPALAAFHLEKLARTGLASKSADGTYVADKAYLKHYVRLRRFLVPRYTFYAALSSLFLLGWIYVFFIPSTISSVTFWNGLHSNYSFLLSFVYVYGVLINVILAAFFWYETYNVLKKEKI